MWLVRTAPLHIGHWGVAITTPEVSRERATVQVSTTLKNETAAPRRVRLSVRLTRNGTDVARSEAEAEIPAGGTSEVVDAAGCVCPDATHRLTFAATGADTLLPPAVPT